MFNVNMLFFLSPLSCGFLQPDQHVVRHHHRFLHRRQLSCHVCWSKVSFCCHGLIFSLPTTPPLLSWSLHVEGAGGAAWSAVAVMMVVSRTWPLVSTCATTWRPLSALANFTQAVFRLHFSLSQGYLKMNQKRQFSVFLVGMNTTGLMEPTSRSPSNALLPSILTTWWHGCRTSWMMRHFSLPRLVRLNAFSFFL